MTRLSSAVLVLSAALLAAPATAQESRPPRRASVAISPFHLLDPQLHVTGELRVTPRGGLAAIIGGGRITDEGETFSIREIGGQLRLYVLGSFSHGMMLGADAGYVHVNGTPEHAMEYFVGTRAGGFLGYKRIMGSGFTVEAQLGPIYVWGKDGASEAQTLTNLTIGWSF